MSGAGKHKVSLPRFEYRRFPRRYATWADMLQTSLPGIFALVILAAIVWAMFHDMPARSDADLRMPVFSETGKTDLLTGACR